MSAPRNSLTSSVLTDAFRVRAQADRTPVKAKSKRPSPLSLRLSQEERAQLEANAAGAPLGAYIKSRVFDESAKPCRTRGQHPVKDHEALARVLSALGRSELPAMLRRLNAPQREGPFSLTYETELAVREACADIAAVRRDVVAALGLPEVR